jgi:hypothetical protein
MKERENMTTSAVAQQPVEQTLRQSPIPALRKLRVEESEKEVVLTGNVTSYYLKQLAQEAVMPVLGKRGLLNQVVVIRTVASD